MIFETAHAPAPAHETVGLGCVRTPGTVDAMPTPNNSAQSGTTADGLLVVVLMSVVVVLMVVVVVTVSEMPTTNKVSRTAGHAPAPPVHETVGLGCAMTEVGTGAEPLVVPPMPVVVVPPMPVVVITASERPTTKQTPIAVCQTVKTCAHALLLLLHEPVGLAPPPPPVARATLTASDATPGTVYAMQIIISIDAMPTTAAVDLLLAIRAPTNEMSPAAKTIKVP